MEELINVNKNRKDQSNVPTLDINQYSNALVSEQRILFEGIERNFHNIGAFSNSLGEIVLLFPPSSNFEKNKDNLKTEKGEGFSISQLIMPENELNPTNYRVIDIPWSEEQQ